MITQKIGVTDDKLLSGDIGISYYSYDVMDGDAFLYA